MFIIVGLVILTSAGFYFYFANYVAKKQGQLGVKITQKIPAELKPIQTYVTTCLDKTARDGLELLGKQSGNIYIEQGGTSFFSDDEENKSFVYDENGMKVLYGINEPKGASCDEGDGCLANCLGDPDCVGATCSGGDKCVIGCITADPDCGFSVNCNPDSGCDVASCEEGDYCLAHCEEENTFDFDCYYSKNPHYNFSCSDDGYCVLGCSTVDDNCNENGYFVTTPNYPWKCFPYPRASSCSVGEKNLIGYFGRSVLIPPLYESDGANSIQAQLIAYIQNNLSDCIDFSSFEEQGFDISEGDILASVNISSMLNLKINYPLKIKNVRTGDKTTMSDFMTNINFNLKELYNYVKYVVDKDITDISYNIKSEPTVTLRVVVQENAINNDDFVIIKDNGFYINREPYEFKFARKNRIPALEYIPDYTENEGNIFSITLNAYDPDEDVLEILCKVTKPDGGDFTVSGGICSLNLDMSGTYIVDVNVTDGVFYDHLSFDIDVIEAG